MKRRRFFGLVAAAPAAALPAVAAPVVEMHIADVTPLPAPKVLRLPYTFTVPDLRGRVFKHELPKGWHREVLFEGSYEECVAVTAEIRDYHRGQKS